MALKLDATTIAADLKQIREQHENSENQTGNNSSDTVNDIRTSVILYEKLSREVDATEETLQKAHRLMTDTSLRLNQL